MASPDEVYACGAGGELLAGPADGLTITLVAQEPLGAVVKWNGSVWVAANGGGLCVLAGDTLACVKPNIKACSLDGRTHLMIAAPDMVVGTADGKSFRAMPIRAYADCVGGGPPRWLDGPDMALIVDLWNTK